MVNMLFSLLCIIGISLILFKCYYKYTIIMYRGSERLDGKTVIITGANSGIGYICAKDFAKRGAKIIMASSNINRTDEAKYKLIQETGNLNIKAKFMDLASFDSIRNFANEILNEEDRIDILLNNAGTNFVGSVKTVDGLNKLMQVNYFGPFLLTNMLLGKMKKFSRIVNVSSFLHKFAKLNLMTMASIGVEIFEQRIYSNSKLALIYFTNELSKKIQNTGITVNSLNPGIFSSNMISKTNFFRRFVTNSLTKMFFKTTEEGAQTSIYLCVSSEIEHLSGKYFENCQLANTSKEACDMTKAKDLWEYTEKIVGLKDYEKHY